MTMEHADRMLRLMALMQEYRSMHHMLTASFRMSWQMLLYPV